jgi:metacaspase-1
MTVNIVRRGILLAVLLIGLADLSVYSQPVKHALVVSISEYSPNSGFRRIDADNDLKIIMKLLQMQGFTDTSVLQNGQATKEGFTASFRKLRSQVHPGDFVYIHFSTHGQQLEDLNGDETDHMDEAIALYDARTRSSDDYKGQNHLTDDEFGTMIEQLRKDLGKKGDILVMVDACHSGSISRGADSSIIRGGYPPLRVTKDQGSTITRGDPVSPVNSGSKHEGLFAPVSNNSMGDLANYIVISACENDEVSSEYCYNHNYFGPLTWAFMNSILNNTRETYTYKELFWDIQNEMTSMFENYATKQNPTMESALGIGGDRLIFGGGAVRQEPFYKVLSFLAPDKLMMQGGNITGIFDSTTVAVYPEGTTDPASHGDPVARGIITKSGYLESVVQLDAPLKSKKPGDYWLFITERKFSGFRVRVSLGTFTNPDLKNKATTLLKKGRFVLVSSDNPSFILEQKKNSNNEMNLLHARSRKPYREGIIPENLPETMMNLVRVRFIKELQVSNPGMKMEISFMPKDTIRLSKSAFIDSKTMRNTVREAKDTAVLWIVNTGKKSFYFNVIDIDPECHYTVILPNIDRPVSECFLKPGERFHVANTFGKPYGTETLKVIASSGEFDLRPLLNSGNETRGTLGDIEGLFDTTYKMRGAPSLPESTDLATFTFYFDVIQ